MTDSRYWLQAEEELDENWTLVRAGTSMPVAPFGGANGGVAQDANMSINVFSPPMADVKDWIDFVMVRLFL